MFFFFFKTTNLSNKTRRSLSSRKQQQRSLDLAAAYLQLKLDERSQELTTVNTLWGLFSFKRLPFGVKTALGIFQEVMDRILNGLPGVVSYFDDILIGATSHKNNMITLSSDS